MVILIIIYIISIIGAILSIRYDQAIFDEDSWTIFLVFCPIVNGGLRQEDTKAQILVNQIDVDDFILFDDSFYSGTTRNKIELKEIRQGCKIIQTVCIYDGGKDPNVTSLYKYYK